MALTSKILPFFDVTRVKLPDSAGTIALDQNHISCVSAGTEKLFVGTPDRTIHILDQTFTSTQHWVAHSGGTITYLKQVKAKACLISIAEDLSRDPELIVWSLDNDDKRSGTPKSLCTLNVQNTRGQFHPITALTIASDLSQIAIGFSDGAVVVVRGDFIHDRGTKQRIVYKSDEPVTGLELREGHITVLYIATTARTLLLPISSNKQGNTIRKLDDRGCAVGCMAMDSESTEIIVARDDGFYTYGTRGKVPPYHFEGAKKLMRLHKDHLLVVSLPNSNAAKSGLPRAFGGSQAQQILNAWAFTIIHSDPKFIAHSETLSSQVNALFNLWNDIFLLTVDGQLYRYHEKTFQQKLDILYQRELYPLAKELAQKYQLDRAQQNTILRKFGDFLYQKGDYETAMQQYLIAIDNTEPSQVIRKFLDNQRIQNLVEYLEELHEHHKATSDHTTLLLNCYAKLKDVDKLEEFIRRPGDISFDLDTAIVMCRQAGYFDQAAFLARRHNEHGLVVDILIEDLKKYAEALAYIVRLEPIVAYPNFVKYGTVLLENCGRDATEVFIEYFTGKFKPKKDAVIVQETTEVQGPSGFSNAAQSAVQNLIALIPLPYMATGSTQAPSGTEGNKGTINQVVETTTEDDFIEYEVPKPRVAFSCFVDHSNEFIVFLEACINSSGVSLADRIDLRTTLFEMYLHQASTSSADDRTEWERKARALIDSQEETIDSSNILLLSELEKFRAGTLIVGERHGLYFDIFRSYTSAHDTKGAIKALHKYGPEEPQLYPAALAYLTSDPKILTEAGAAEIDSILRKIEDDGLLAPLQVIQTLSASSVATVGLIKSYLTSIVERERKEISANREAIAAYRTDTARKQSDLSTLMTEPASISNSRCATCARPIDLPAVHFLCKHSYHQRCLDITEGQSLDEVECPLCAEQNRTVRQILAMQKKTASQVNSFRSDLSNSKDHFGTISDWVGKGVMESQAN